MSQLGSAKKEARQQLLQLCNTEHMEGACSKCHATDCALHAMCAAGYNGPFYNQAGVQLGSFSNSVANINDNTIIQQVPYPSLISPSTSVTVACLRMLKAQSRRLCPL